MSAHSRITVVRFKRRKTRETTLIVNVCGIHSRFLLSITPNFSNWNLKKVFVTNVVRLLKYRQSEFLLCCGVL